MKLLGLEHIDVACMRCMQCNSQTSVCPSVSPKRRSVEKLLEWKKFLMERQLREICSSHCYMHDFESKAVSFHVIYTTRKTLGSLRQRVSNFICFTVTMTTKYIYTLLYRVVFYIYLFGHNLFVF
jgi:hypothetical protein